MGNSFVACRRSIDVRYELDTRSYSLPETIDRVIIPQKLRKIRNFKIDEQLFKIDKDFSQSLAALNIGEFRTPFGSYLGQMEMNKRHGLGIQDYENSNERYIGQFQENKIEGTGAFIFDNDAIYFGNWKDNVPNGLGVIFAPEGVIQCGIFKNSHIEGNAIYITQQFVYRGQFENGQQNGVGIQSWCDSTIYKGQWQNGMMHGYGQLIKPNKIQYEGYFSNNLKQGEGVEHQIESGISYHGSFIGGMRGGFGIEVISDKQLQRAGIWVCGELNELIFIRNEQDEHFQAYKQSNEEPELKNFNVTLDEPKEKEQMIVRLYQSQLSMKSKVLDKLEDKTFKQEIQQYQEKIKYAEQYLLDQQKNADYLVAL